LEENKNLKNIVEQLNLEIADKSAIQSENIVLRQQLALSSEKRATSSFIISRPPQLPLDTLLIDAGLDKGIEVGDKVTFGERTIVGSIGRVFSEKSEVVLNSFPDVVSYVYIDRTKEQIEMKGIGGGVMESYVPMDFDVKVGDSVMMSEGMVYLAGVVKVIDSDIALGSKRVLLSIPVNMYRVLLVSIHSKQ
jgi:cell shape-determining protein MreC